MTDSINRLRDKYSRIANERFFDEVFVSKIYEDALNQKLDVVVDLGALAGEFSAYVYDKANKIYAIEMKKNAYDELVQNIKEFGLSKIKPYRLAITDYKGTATMLKNADRGSHRVLRNTEEEEGSELEKAPCMTLAQFMKQEGIERINVLKIDIEDGEQYVFGSKDFKDIADKIDYIIGEHAGTHLLKPFGFTIDYNGTIWNAKRT